MGTLASHYANTRFKESTGAFERATRTASIDVPFYLKYLDDDQYSAATSGDGITRVMAGAGTGKTTTLISRVLYLLRERKISPEKIVVVTFTKKAANEVYQRLEEALSDIPEHTRMFIMCSVRIGTFHALCARFLRRISYRDISGASRKFTVIDDDDSKSVIKDIMADNEVFHKNQDIKRSVSSEGQNQTLSYDQMTQDLLDCNDDAVRYMTDDVYTQIQRWKENGISFEKIAGNTISSKVRYTHFEKECLGVFEEYEKYLASHKYMDYCDLILKTCDALESNKILCRSAANSVEYLLVDEFQDVNRIQKQLVDLLTSAHGNLFVVGDVDQSIYAFRGSTPKIMRGMEPIVDHDIVLRQNRRCTKQILVPANNVIGSISGNEREKLVSKKTGHPVECFSLINEYAEAAWIGKRIETLVKSGVHPQEIAVITRTSNALRSIEAQLFSRNVDYNLVSGTSILETEEIKDFVCYLRLIHNPYDELAFSRIINKPSRLIGPTGNRYIRDTANKESLDYLEACEQIVNGSGDTVIKAKARKNISEFLELIQEAQVLVDNAKWMDMYNLIVEKSGYLAWFKKREKETVFQKRHSNLIRIGAVIRMINPESLSDILDYMALSFDKSEIDVNPDKVNLSTVHAAKGMEFSHVFCPSFEEGNFPHYLSLSEDIGADDVDLDDPWDIIKGGGINEEKRLAHVAFTRAKESLYVTWCKKRGNKELKESQFIKYVGSRGNPNIVEYDDAPKEQYDEVAAQKARMFLKKSNLSNKPNKNAFSFKNVKKDSSSVNRNNA